jgi:hypothetical protein
LETKMAREKMSMNGAGEKKLGAGSMKKMNDE